MNQDTSVIRRPIEEMAFIDIETVAHYKTLLGAPGPYRLAWEVKSKNMYPDMDIRMSYVEKAALHPEFSKVCCISIGVVKILGTVPQKLIIKSFCGTTEADVLHAFSEAISGAYYRNMVLAGHNIEGFDIPVLNKRYIINGLPIPKKLNFNGSKPWERDMVDTYNVWKFTGMNSCSLDLLCLALGVPSPKEVMDAKSVHHSFHINQDLDSIANYCAGDVKATAHVVMKIKGIEFDFPTEIV